MTRLRIARIAAALAGAAALAATGIAQAAPEGARWGRDWFPHHEVIAHTGERFDFYADLVENKIVIVNFIYTRCSDVCPLQTARLAKVVERLAAEWGDRLGRDVFVYSITLEPEVDTPAVLASLAEAFETPPGWLFLTGEPAELAEIRRSLGDRSRSLGEHGNDLMIGNDRTASWTRSSIFADTERVAVDIMDMDPAHRAIERASATDYTSVEPVDITGDRGRGLFVKACASCHGFGRERSLGPDLAGVTSRRDPDWLARFIQAPDRLRREGDPTALALDAAYPRITMPSLGLSETDVADLMHFIAAQDAARSIAPAND